MEAPTEIVVKEQEPQSTASAVTADSAMAGEHTRHHPENNIFVAAMRGDVALVREFIESGQAKATDRDDQNVTPLHLASINAQVATCQYLLEQGAEVDALGGELLATPLQWAVAHGYLFVMRLLISHNADPTITDLRGYNALHVATHSGNVVSLLYLLHHRHHPTNVDSRNSEGRTNLMLAAHQGDELLMDLLLKHGASPIAHDNDGRTPLHWAVVGGNEICIRRLVEQGADLTAEDSEGRTPRDKADEFQPRLDAWKEALERSGMNEYGDKRWKPLSERNTKLAIFVSPGKLPQTDVASLSIYYGTPVTPSTPKTSTSARDSIFNLEYLPSCFLPTKLCLITRYDPFLVYVTVGANLPLPWTILLLASQFWQILKQMTTFEVINLGRYGFMGEIKGSRSRMRPRRGQIIRPYFDDAALSYSTYGTPGSGYIRLDHFADGKTRTNTTANPFDLGMWGNCKDFWTLGKELGVEYDKLYDIPLEGFFEVKKRREREGGVDEHGLGQTGPRKWESLSQA
ncbi:palmitoyltransferase akr1 [Marasmius crinis-equi]|uniref:protein S-acyltransferase n=1 Tax=Marasmius crinis-equi TaxID=585013 RepID=A0ABR3EUY2_9AGAR